MKKYRYNNPINLSPRGEIGRHKGLKILAACGVPVRVWPRAPILKMSINRVTINYFIIFSGIIFFLVKWSHSFLLFTEDINVKIIFEALADGYKYFPLFKYFSELNLDISYNNNIS